LTTVGKSANLLALKEPEHESTIIACIPAYNEENHIARVILETQKFVDKVIVCNDGSDDMTGEIASTVGAIVLTHERNMGKGAAIKTMWEACSKMEADIIVTLDGDGQHDPSDIPKVIEPILSGKADLSIGCRMQKRAMVPLHRRLGNQLLTTLTNLGTKRKILDTQSGFRAYSKRALKKIEIVEDGIGVDSQILFEASRIGLSVAETDVSVRYGGDTSTYHPVRHGVDVVLAIVRYTAERRPLTILGIPGIILLALGLSYGGLLLQIYISKHEFILAYALLAVGGTLLGAFTILAAFILYVLSVLIKKLPRAD
jgi:glycosyltransferase involved in cell wall biosynthesis